MNLRRRTPRILKIIKEQFGKNTSRGYMLRNVHKSTSYFPGFFL